jgi:hypothetical protein
VLVSFGMESTSKHLSFPSRPAGGIHSVGGAFPMACGVDSPFRGNDCTWERPRLANDTSAQILVVGQFDVEAAEPVPILSGRRHMVSRLTNKLAATTSSSLPDGNTGTRVLSIKLEPG